MELVIGGYLDVSYTSLKSVRPAVRPQIQPLVVFCSTRSLIKEKGGHTNTNTAYMYISGWSQHQGHIKPTLWLRFNIGWAAAFSSGSQWVMTRQQAPESCTLATGPLGGQNETQAQSELQNEKQSFCCFHYPGALSSCCGSLGVPGFRRQIEGGGGSKAVQKDAEGEGRR